MNTSPKTGFDFRAAGGRELPRLRGVFVTGTDTEVGKTLLAGAIAAELRRGGLSVDVFKPAATGCRVEGGVLVSDDAAFLARCAGSRRPLAEIAPVRFATPAAPNVAAKLDRRPLELEAIFRAYERLAGSDCVVVEGVGGLLCPISDDLMVIHFAAMTGLPLVVVAHAGLGTINHTLLTIHAARSAGLDVAGVLVNRMPDNADAVTAENPRQIGARGAARVLAVVPDEPQSSVERGTIGPRTSAAIAGVDWKRIIGLGR